MNKEQIRQFFVEAGHIDYLLLYLEDHLKCLKKEKDNNVIPLFHTRSPEKKDIVNLSNDNFDAEDLMKNTSEIEHLELEIEYWKDKKEEMFNKILQYMNKIIDLEKVPRFYCKNVNNGHVEAGWYWIIISRNCAMFKELRSDKNGLCLVDFAEGLHPVDTDYNLVSIKKYSDDKKKLLLLFAMEDEEHYKQYLKK